MRKVLLMGSGSSRAKRIHTGEGFEWEPDVLLVRADYMERHKPDVVADFGQHPLPFVDESFDQIHAYEILEHLGSQGDWKFFFAEFTEYWRILKPLGLMFIMVPAHDSFWAWGDPSHTRVLNAGTFSFLAQACYEEVGKTARSDFRDVWKHNFEIIYANNVGGNLALVLQKS